MTSILWVVVAFFAGGLAGAILVALMHINRGDEDVLAPPLEAVDDADLRLLA